MWIIFTADRIFLREKYKIGDKIKVSKSIRDKLIKEGVAKDYKEEKKK